MAYYTCVKFWAESYLSLLFEMLIVFFLLTVELDSSCNL